MMYLKMLVYILKGPSPKAKESTRSVFHSKSQTEYQTKKPKPTVALRNDSHESGAESRAISPRPDFETDWFTTATLWVEVEVASVDQGRSPKRRPFLQGPLA
jgi:hypothetical protein